MHLVHAAAAEPAVLDRQTAAQDDRDLVAAASLPDGAPEHAPDQQEQP
ncbi:hypothetical protein [Cellulomonas triticagri]|nr:hypothetical protein [Cellulomonas triticagri]